MALPDPSLSNMANSQDGLVVPRAEGLGFLLEDRQDHQVDLRDKVYTKLLCTIGPNQCSEDVLLDWLNAGMTAALFDLTVGGRDVYREAVTNLRNVCRTANKLCAIVLDTDGPNSSRVLLEEGQSIQLSKGQTVVLTTEPGAKATNQLLPLSSMKWLPQAVKTGDTIFVGRYLASGSDNLGSLLRVEKVEGNSIICSNETDEAKLDGLVTCLHVNAKGEHLPALSAYDIEEVKKWDEPELVDYVSLTYCRSSADVHELRKVLKSSKNLQETRIIANLQSLEALSNFEEILEAADAIMISRGDLGVAIPVEKMIQVQKYIVKRCNAVNKAVLVTRIVDSMCHDPRPTRAEATDVANAVLDGVDCLVLGPETVRGAWPLKSIRTVLAICGEAEKAFNSVHYFQKKIKAVPIPMPSSQALAAAAVRSATRSNAALIVTFTTSGLHPRLISSFRPKMPVLAVQMPTVKKVFNRWITSGLQTARQGLIYYGILPMLMSTTKDTAAHYACECAKRLGLVKKGDQIVVTQRIKQCKSVAILEIE